MPTYGRKRFYRRKPKAAVHRARRMAALQKRRVSRAEVRDIARRTISRTKETKELSGSSSLGDVYNGAESLTRLTNIGQGDTDADRDGDKCLLKYLTLGIVGSNGIDTSTGTATNPVRIMVVKHKRRAVATALTTADFPDYWTRVTEAQRHKYQVLRDIKFMARSSVLPYWDATSGALKRDHISVRFQRFLRIPLNFQIRWDEGATGSGSNALQGDVYLYITCRNSTVGSGLKSVSYEKDLHFKEL